MYSRVERLLGTWFTTGVIHFWERNILPFYKAIQQPSALFFSLRVGYVFELRDLLFYISFLFLHFFHQFMNSYHKLRYYIVLLLDIDVHNVDISLSYHPDICKLHATTFIFIPSWHYSLIPYYQITSTGVWFAIISYLLYYELSPEIHFLYYLSGTSSSLPLSTLLFLFIFLAYTLGSLPVLSLHKNYEQNISKRDFSKWPFRTRMTLLSLYGIGVGIIFSLFSFSLVVTLMYVFPSPFPFPHIRFLRFPRFSPSRVFLFYVPLHFPSYTNSFPLSSFFIPSILFFISFFRVDLFYSSEFRTGRC